MRMHRSESLLISVLSIALAGVGAAQEMMEPKPHAEMAKFDALIGAWEGEGVYREDAAGQPMPWKAVMVYSRILSGFAVQEDLVIDVGAPTKLTMRNVYGIDQGSGDSLALGLSNQGQASLMDWAFPSADKFIVFGADRTQMGIAVGRTVLSIGKDGLTMAHEGCRDAGKYFTEVEGKFKRMASAPELGEHPAFVGTEVSAEMKAMMGMGGKWNVAGTMVMAPGMDAMPIKGTETSVALFGGHAVFSSTVGDGPDGQPAYFGHTYTVWNPVRKRYDVIGFDTMGMVMRQTGLWAEPGKTFVVTGISLWMGTLNAQSATMHLNEHGIERVVAHALANGQPSYECFNAKYVKANGN